jgi:N-acetylmuramoyl-L-alanine amidase
MAVRRWAATLGVAASIALLALALTAAPVDAADGGYTVRPGDTLWAIAERNGVPIETLVRVNRLADPNHIEPGQRLALGQRPGGTEAVRGAAARELLVAAAREQGVNPNFVLAVSLWESGQNQAMVSKDGAIGLMQILPLTAEWAGPALLHKRVDLRDARDNARLGAALLRRYLDEFGDPRLALAAYYQGERAVREHGIYPSSQRYVNGIWALRNQLEAAG